MNMPSCLHEMVSAMWIGMTGRYQLTTEDKATEAEDQLGRLLQQLDRREEALQTTMRRLGVEALQLKGSDRGRCKHKVMEHRRSASQLERLVAYKDTVMQHVDALRNTELNKTLISALQESSKTLKSMGIVDGVRHAEAVVSDVEQSMAQAQELTSVLGMPIGVGLSDEELDAELGLLETPWVVHQMEPIMEERVDTRVAVAT